MSSPVRFAGFLFFVMMSGFFNIAAASKVEVATYWQNSYFRIDLTSLNILDGQINYRFDGASISFKSQIPDFDREISYGDDSFLITSRKSVINIQSRMGKRLRVNLSHLRSGVFDGRPAFTAIDIYPDDKWVGYNPIGVASCSNEDDGVQRLQFISPDFVSGALGFYMAEIDPVTLKPKRIIENDADSLYPLASTFKQIVLWGLLKEVNSGQVKLNQKILVTPRNQSIEYFQPGERTILNLAQQMIYESENTAADILHLLISGRKLQKLVYSKGACNTSVRMTTKAWWAAQGGLLSDVYGDDVFGSSASVFNETSSNQDDVAERAVLSAQNFGPLEVNDALDRYFYSDRYDPNLEVYLQNRSTPREWSKLIAKMYFDTSLSQSNLNLLKNILSKGCCHTGKYSYWGSKAGSGWRIITMSGMVKLPSGRFFVYSYFNSGSDVMESPLIEKQIGLISDYILENAQRLDRY